VDTAGTGEVKENSGLGNVTLIPLSMNGCTMESELKPDYKIIIDQVISNLKRWKPIEWAIFWGLIPAILLLVYALPQGIRDDWFILNTVYPWRLQTWFLSSYTHSQLYPHLIGNLEFYFGSIITIFAFESNKRRFYVMAGWSFLIVPIISSVLTIALWGIFEGNTTGQGFSAIVGAFLSYALFAFVVGLLKEKLKIFDHPESFVGSKIRYNILKILIIALLATMVVAMGILFGAFVVAGNTMVNGIAHFGGFITSMIVLFIFDLKNENRKYFDRMLGMSILIGLFVYVYYLALIVRLVKGS